MSTILDLSGNPISLPSDESKKRFALVGSINVHFALFELQEGETVADALRTQQMMARSRDPQLAEITRTERIYWAEDDETRATNRAMACQQLIAFFTNLGPDGTKHSPHPVYTEDQMQRMIDHALAHAELKGGTGDGSPFPNPDDTLGKKGL